MNAWQLLWRLWYHGPNQLWHLPALIVLETVRIRQWNLTVHQQWLMWCLLTVVICGALCIHFCNLCMTSTAQQDPPSSALPGEGTDSSGSEDIWWSSGNSVWSAFHTEKQLLDTECARQEILQTENGWDRGVSTYATIPRINHRSQSEGESVHCVSADTVAQRSWWDGQPYTAPWLIALRLLCWGTSHWKIAPRLSRSKWKSWLKLWGREWHHQWLQPPIYTWWEGMWHWDISCFRMTMWPGPEPHCFMDPIWWNLTSPTSSIGNIVCVTGPLCGESTGRRWISLTKASDAELWCFLWCAHKYMVDQTINISVIWDAMALIVTSL